MGEFDEHHGGGIRICPAWRYPSASGLPIHQEPESKSFLVTCVLQSVTLVVYFQDLDPSTGMNGVVKFRALRFALSPVPIASGLFQYPPRNNKSNDMRYSQF